MTVVTVRACWALPAILLIAAPAFAAETTDTVFLKNGGLVRGKVLVKSPGKYVLIQTAAGDIKNIPWSEVLTVTPGAPGGKDTVTIPQEGAGQEPDEDAAQKKKPPQGLDLRKGIGYTTRTVLKESEARRQAWLRRGGHLVGYEYNLGLLYVSVAGVHAPAMTGGFNVNYLFLRAPDVAKKETTWYGFRAGSGLSFAGGAAFADETSGFFLLQVPFSFGGQFGWGGFDSKDQWEGIVFGVDYRPSYTYSEPGGGGSFNPLGFNFTLDWTTLKSAMGAFARQAHFRFSFFLLPPIGDLPFILALNFGKVWY